jgi:hypothetical protein
VTRNIGQHTPKIVMLDAPFFQVLSARRWLCRRLAQ